jgi:hypothetical protein
MELAKVTIVTHCDINYVAKAHSLICSLKENNFKGVMVVVCHDQESLSRLTSLKMPEVYLFSISQVEELFPQLLVARLNRPQIEYYYCVTPFLVKFIMRKFDSDFFVYLDSDTYFFSDFLSALETHDDYVVAITPHRFRISNKNLEIYGKYNVGLMSFKKCSDSENIIDWWAKQCLVSTSIDLNEGVCGDQKYLDDFENLSLGVKQLDNPGHNVAPWNFSDVVAQDGELKVIENSRTNKLVYFHFSGLKRYSFFSVLGFMPFRNKANKRVKKLVYKPYLKSLCESEYQLGLHKTERSKSLGYLDFIHTLRYFDLTLNPRLSNH